MDGICWIWCSFFTVLFIFHFFYKYQSILTFQRSQISHTQIPHVHYNLKYIDMIVCHHHSSFIMFMSIIPSPNHANKSQNTSHTSYSLICAIDHTIYSFDLSVYNKYNNISYSSMVPMGEMHEKCANNIKIGTSSEHPVTPHFLLDIIHSYHHYIIRCYVMMEISGKWIPRCTDLIEII